MRKIELKSRKLLRIIFGSLSLTAMAFVFQACYGPPPDRHRYDDGVEKGCSDEIVIMDRAYKDEMNVELVEKE